MTIESLKAATKLCLQQHYDAKEAANIALWLIEDITGYSNSLQIVHKQQVLSEAQQEKANLYLDKLATGMPVQYVLGYAWFARLKFFVNPSVLIPRPETEELVDWIINEHQSKQQLSILDIGTGSGCIAISLKQAMPHSKIAAIDISVASLDTARQNAVANNADIYFKQTDFLDIKSWNDFGKFDVIVSNPPYIKQSEQIQMHKNVLEFEPHTALFVQDNDALIFYTAIANFALQHLKQNASLYVEINEELAVETEQTFINAGFKTQLKKDLQGKYRMIKAFFS